MHLSDRLSTSMLRTTQTFIDALKEMNIMNIGDLLLHLPRAYENLSEMKTLDDVEDGDKVAIRGSVSNVKLIRTRTGKQFVRADFTDTEGGVCEVIWFNQPHIKRMLAGKSEVVLHGKIGWKGNKLQLQSPTFESGTRDLLHAGKIVPVYPQHDVINTRWLREKIALVQDAIDEFDETLPKGTVADEGLMPRAKMIRTLHFPESGEGLQQAKNRQSFEELFWLQRDALKRKREWQKDAQIRLAIPMNIELIKAFFASLKFTPTDSQRVAIYEILRDLEKQVPMSRLLEGDVGSGKTLVATAVMANVIQAGGQCALMVPTEVLAKQHAESIAKLFQNFWKFVESHAEMDFALGRSPTIALLTGSTPEPQARETKLGLARGTIDLVVGTHSLIQKGIKFKDLRIAIVDEQHRFGVQQRDRLKENGSPHFLSMTATPIPRTLALTAFGDHDLSVLMEKPGNRKEIKTKIVPPKERVTVERFIDGEIEKGRQAYVICPLITESEELEDVRNVETESKRMQKVFPHRTVLMLHGKLKPQEKDTIMREFKERKADILVSTSVIEVGIDVPNASIILIEGAERFGLSQLHQLRGRVGRDIHQSYCFLCTTESQHALSDRLRAMEKYASGFHLAEIDLKLRGPGEIYGTRQSGIPEIRASSLTDPALVVRARKAAEKYLGMDKSAVKKI